MLHSLAHPVKVTIGCNFDANERLGSAKIALREADELERLGASVRRVFRESLPPPRDGRKGSLTAPFRMATTLFKEAADSDVCDVAGGDGFSYAFLARRLRPKQAVVARSNGLWVKCLETDEPARRGPARALASKLLQEGVICRWEAASIRNATWARVLSSPDRDEIATFGWKVRERISVVNPAPDASFDSETPIEGRSGIAFLGSWIPRKGTRVAAAVFSRLLQARPGLDVSVLGSGADEPTVLAAFDPAVRHRVKVTPWASPAELGVLMSKQSVLLFPTLYEGFGLVVVEAMRAGAAVVTTPTGAGVDAVRDGESGLVVPIGDEAATERAVARLLDDEALRVRLASAGRREAQSRSWRRSAEELLACYESALRVVRG